MSSSVDKGLLLTSSLQQEGAVGATIAALFNEPLRCFLNKRLEKAPVAGYVGPVFADSRYLSML